jgi:drug/metabolite transporter (DMT)-like permease
MKKYRGEAALLLITVIWGGTFALIKNALTDISPSIFLALRFIIASVILFPFLYLQIKNINRETLIAGVILAVFFFFGFQFQTIGLNYTTATKSGFITGTFVVIIPILQTIIEKRKPKLHNILGVILVFVGLIFLSSKGENIFHFLEQLGSDLNIGDLLTFICAILFAFQVVYVDIFTKKYPFMPMVFIQLFISAIGGTLATIILPSIGLEQTKFSLNSNVIVAILYTSVFASIIAISIQLKYQKVVSPTKAGIIYSFEPIMAAIIAYLILSERISNFGLIGGAFIFAGLLVSEIFSSKDE